MKFPMLKDPTSESKKPVAGSGFLLFRCDNCDDSAEVGWGKKMDRAFFDPAHLVAIVLDADPRIMHQCKDGGIGICVLIGASQEKGPASNDRTH